MHDSRKAVRRLEKSWQALFLSSILQPCMAIEITDIPSAPPVQPEIAIDVVPVPSPATPADKAAALGLRRTAIVGSAQHRITNERFTSAALKYFLLAMVLMLGGFATFAAMLHSFYQKEVQPYLRHTPASLARPELADDPRLQTALEEAHQRLGQASSQILRLQKQIDDLRQGQSTSDERLKVLAEKLLQASADTAGKPAPTATDVAAAIQIASVIPSQSAAGAELWLMKERNRLTAYADEAIAQGSSSAMASLWASLRDPEMDKLRHGAETEIIRVQNHYARISRLPDEYRLPVSDLFPGKGLRAEADLQPAQLIALLHDQKQSMVVRARAAYVLGSHPTQPVGEALLSAMKNDPSLDVAREAQRTLTDIFSMPVPLLHTNAAEAWWQSRPKK